MTKAFLGIAVIGLMFCAARGAEGDGFKRVATARYFAFGGIGVAGITSEEEIGFREVLASKTAAADFLRLLNAGNDEGKCYALVGLRLKDRAAFEKEAKRIADSRKEIETVAGCMITKQTVAAVVVRIQAGDYDQQAQRELKRPKSP